MDITAKKKIFLLKGMQFILEAFFKDFKFVQKSLYKLLPTTEIKKQTKITVQKIKVCQFRYKRPKHASPIFMNPFCHCNC